MANKQDIDFTYTTMDKIFRLSIGEMADFSGAKYDAYFLRLNWRIRFLHWLVVSI